MDRVSIAREVAEAIEAALHGMTRAMLRLVLVLDESHPVEPIRHLLSGPLAGAPEEVHHEPA